ncbi:MAG: tRNA (adenosine(37)-N6)-threonylcarbamoyltransferase complex transferase subunit TsaD [Myxococcota bacterium]
MYVLGIETSCDETAASIVGPDGVRSDVVHTQEIHQIYGGVVPELAGRAHAERVVATARAALDRAGLSRPDAVAATAGPGLMGAVLVGLCFGKAAAAGWGVPFIGVNHLEGHLLSPLLEDPAPTFPFLALVVSGGHTTVYLAKSLGEYEVLGQTVDDAAGEAFDKVARMMGLGYPGGPFIDRLAQQGKSDAIDFPRTVIRAGTRTRGSTRERSDLDMSFSGLKTAVRTHLERTDGWSAPNVAASFQTAVVDVLCDRVARAAERYGVRQLALAGGVAANTELRERMASLPMEVFIPPRSRCTDNGAMIANAGRLRLLMGQQDALDVGARASWTPGT